MRRLIGMRVSGRCALMAAILLLALFSVTPVHAQQSWNMQIVDENGTGLGGGYCPIVLDSNNVPSIAYTGISYTGSGSTVRCARWNSSIGGFSTQQIASGYATDIALDANNNPVVLCYSRSPRGLQYVSWNGTSWESQKVDDYYNYGVIVFDSHGNPHVAYTWGNRVKYASHSGSGWAIQTVDTFSPSPVVQYHLSLALDSKDTPYILYAFLHALGGSTVDLNLAVGTSSGWNIQTIASQVPCSWGKMVLDSEGCPHLAYGVAGADRKIMYSRWNGFAWKTETVASNIHLYVSNSGSLALDLHDYPHISYFTSEGLMCASWTGLEWIIQTVDSNAGAVGGTSYLVVASNRIPHISYANAVGVGHNTSINYAVASEPVPLASPLLIALPLLSLVAAVAIVSAAIIAYLWRKK
jgi:hypothetical protein